MANGAKGESVDLSWPVTHSVPVTIGRSFNIGDRLFRAMTAGFALSLLAVFVSILAVLTYESSDSIRRFGWQLPFQLDLGSGNQGVRRAAVHLRHAGFLVLGFAAGGAAEHRHGAVLE